MVQGAFSATDYCWAREMKSYELFVVERLAVLKWGNAKARNVVQTFLSISPIYTMAKRLLFVEK